MKTRTMQTNELRLLLYEFGIVLPEDHGGIWPGGVLIEGLQLDIASTSAEAQG